MREFFGFKKITPAVESVDLKKRAFLRNSAAAVGTVAIGAVAGRSLHTFEHTSEADVSSTELPEASATAERKIGNESEQFEKFTSGFAAWWTMPRTSLLFVDKDNAPVGQLEPFRDLTFPKRIKHNGKMEVMPYLCMPVAKDENENYIVGNIAPEWSNRIEEIHASENGVSVMDLERLNVAQDFVSALEQSDEPELQEQILSGEITTNLEIVHYFGNKPTRGAEHLTREEYVRSEIQFHNPRMSAVVQNELRELLPALCAKESKFNDDLKNHTSGARGISQFVPATWQGLGYGDYGESQPLKTQIEAMGKHCDNIYNELMSDGVSDLLETYVAPLFASRADFERDFLVPCMINAYNPGAGTMRSAIKQWLEVTDTTDFLEMNNTIVGKDVFFSMNRFALQAKEGLLATYAVESANYVGYIYAMRDVLASEKQQKQQDSTKVANN